MSTYSLLIIDDERDRDDEYNNLFCEFNLIIVPNITKLDEYVKAHNVSGYIVDVVLDNWKISLSDALNIIGQKGPVFLISSKFGKMKDRELAKVLDNIIDSPVKGFFTWSEFYIKEPKSNKTKVNQDAINTANLKIINELNRFHERSSLQINPDENVYFLHISDTQFGDPDIAEDAFLSETAIGNYLRRKQLLPHFLVISGDIAYSGRPSEYEQALSWFRRLFNELWPSQDMRERILIVPGNHDVNLRFCAADRYDYDIPSSKLVESSNISLGDHGRFGLAPFMEFAYELTGDRRWLNYQNSLCWFSDRFLHLGFRFYHINSVAEVVSDTPNKKSIPKNQLSKMTEPHCINTSVFNIVISHHGTPIGSNEGYENWNEVKNFFEVINADLLIHGHGHAWKGYTLQDGKYIYNMVNIMSPSSHVNNRVRPLNERRGFCVIQLERNDNEVIKIYGQPYEMVGTEIKERETPKNEWDAPKILSPR